MASGRNNAARKYEDQVPAQREVQPKRHLQVAAAPVKKKAGMTIRGGSELSCRNILPQANG